MSELFAGSRRSACAVTARPSALTMEGTVNISSFLAHYWGRGKLLESREITIQGPALWRPLRWEQNASGWDRVDLFCCWQKQKRRRKWNLKKNIFSCNLLVQVRRRQCGRSGTRPRATTPPTGQEEGLAYMSKWHVIVMLKSRQMNYIEMAVFTGFTNTGGVAALEVKVPPHRYRTSLPPTLR